MPLSIRGVLTVPLIVAPGGFSLGYQPAVSAMCVCPRVNRRHFSVLIGMGLSKMLCGYLHAREAQSGSIASLRGLHSFVENSGQTDYRSLIVGDGDEARL